METFGTIYLFAVFAVLDILRNRFFAESLRLKPWIVYTIICTICFASAGYWIATDGMLGAKLITFRLIIGGVLFLMSCVMIKEYFFKHALFYILVLSYYAPIEATSRYIDSLSGLDNSHFVSTVVSFGLLVLTIFPYSLMLKKLSKHFTRFKSHKVWIFLFIAAAATFFVDMIATFNTNQLITLPGLISRWISFSGIIAIIACAYLFVKSIEDSISARSELEVIQVLRATQKAYYERVLEQMDEIRRIRHDLRHHYATISAIAEQNDIEGIKNYIASYRLPEASVFVTGNVVTDSILMHCNDHAKAYGVKIDADISIGKKLPIPDPDFCVIIGNLTENAVEAQQYVPEEKRFVRVKMQGDEKRLTLTVDNAYDGFLKNKNGVYASRKAKKGHGVGLKSVRSICEKHNGILQIETTNDTFMAGVVIGI